MAQTIKKVSIYRRWQEPAPEGKDGKPIAKELWPKRRRHSWVVRWVDNHGKRRGKMFKIRKEAERFAHEVQDKIFSGKADRLKKISLRDFRLEHEKVMLGQVSYATYLEHKKTLQLFEKFIGGSIELANVKPRDAEAFIAHKHASKKLAVPTVNKYLRTLKAIFNRAIDPREYLPEGSNPFAKIKPRKVTDKPKRYVNIKEYFALMKAADEKLWWKTFIAVAYSSGLRLNEILNLTWSNIDFVNQRINVDARKGNSKVIAWEPKGRKNRVVPISSEALKFLVDIQVDAPDGHPYVFISPDRLKRIFKRMRQGSWKETSEIINNMGTDFGRIRIRAGIAKATIHDLRRSAITNWADKLPFQVVHKLAGHSNIKTTMEHYLAVRPEDYTLAGGILDQLVEKEQDKVTQK